MNKVSVRIVVENVIVSETEKSYWINVKNHTENWKSVRVNVGIVVIHIDFINV